MKTFEILRRHMCNTIKAEDEAKKDPIIYARMLGYSNYELYLLSRRLIGGGNNAKCLEAHNSSYTDIYDFSSAVHKQSLKKWENELDISHKELLIRLPFCRRTLIKLIKRGINYENI